MQREILKLYREGRSRKNVHQNVNHCIFIDSRNSETFCFLLSFAALFEHYTKTCTIFLRGKKKTKIKEFSKKK